MYMRTIFLCLFAWQVLLAQVPKISVLDFYGLRHVTESRLRRALGVQEGDSLPASKVSAEERLEQVDGVFEARLEAVCCEAGGAVLFIGIEEKAAPHFDFRNAPSSSVILSEEVVDMYRAFLERYQQVARTGAARESLEQGYALSSDPTVRGYQERFVALAGKEFAALRNVLRDSSEPEHRVMAAYLIGFAKDKAAAVETLQYALQDPEPPVRHTALRALGAIAVFDAKTADPDIRVSPTWAIEMLNSIEWSDRNSALDFLVQLTESRDKSTLDQIRERASSSLMEMARWKSLTHALPAFILVARIVGLTEGELQDVWSKGERETVISKLPSSGRTTK